MKYAQRNKTYWQKRAEGYSQVNREELAGDKRREWLQVIRQHIPAGIQNEAVQILDVGTGPGFFAIILAEAGYCVTAVDYTDNMLCQARRNAGALCEKIRFLQMDAQSLEFPDGAFHIVLSRNLTWNLRNPQGAYSEWHRVLKPGGVLLNFDANWYSHLYKPEERAGYERDRQATQTLGVEDYYAGTDIDEMEAIAKQAPLSKLQRPEWDRRILGDIGFSHIQVDPHIGDRVWTDTEKINFEATPLFLIAAAKTAAALPG